MIVAWFKDKRHLDWIKREGKVNLRLGARRGALKVTAELAAAKHILLHSERTIVEPGLLRIQQQVGEVFTGRELKNHGYTETAESDDIYAVFEVLPDPIYADWQWDGVTLSEFWRSSSVSAAGQLRAWADFLLSQGSFPCGISSRQPDDNARATSMADIITKKRRSEVMAAVRSRGNSATELVLGTLLRKLGITGWRRHVGLPGRPDFTFRASRLLVFVDGCFWHGCAKHCRVHATNRNYWLRKIQGNRSRDRAVSQALRKAGWRVLRIWEHELNRPAICARRINRLLGSRLRDHPHVSRYSLDNRVRSI